MVNFAPKIKRLGWPSGLLGLFLSFNLLMVLLSFAVPVSDAGAFDACGGDYPCYTRTACTRSDGFLQACPGKCPSSNQGYCFANMEAVELSVSIGALDRTIDLGQYIQAIYRYGVGAAAVLAAVMIMIGGLQWLTSRGAGQVGKAKTRIRDASIGLLITIFAWFILNTINPALVNLQMPRIPMAQKQQFVACDQFRLQVACGQSFSLVEVEGASESAAVTERFRIASLDDPQALATCFGASCSKAGSSDANNTCQSTGGSAGDQPSVAPGGEIEQPISPYECRACVSNGNRCDGPKGLNSSCCGGYCGISLTGEGARNWEVIWDRAQNRATYDTASLFGEFALQMADLPGVCRSGRDGDFCMGNNECLSGSCVLGTDWQRGGICSSGRAAALCDSSDDCAGEAFCLDHACYPKAVGGYCRENEHCPEGTNCVRQFCTSYTQPAGEYVDPAQAGCENSAQCVDRYGEGYVCTEVGGVGQLKRCTNGQPGSTCRRDSDCQLNGNNGRCNLNLTQEWIGDIGVCVPFEAGVGCEYRGEPSFITKAWNSLTGASQGSGSSCGEGVIYCVQDVGGDDTGVYLASGDAGQPCVTGICGRQGTCNPGLVCSTSGNICVAE